MSTSADELSSPCANRILFDNDSIIVELEDGRTVSAPVSWYPRLANASEEERNNWEIFGRTGLHWPDIDEDISVLALLAGKASNESQSSLQKWLDKRDGNDA